MLAGINHAWCVVVFIVNVLTNKFVVLHTGNFAWGHVSVWNKHIFIRFFTLYYWAIVASKSQEIKRDLCNQYFEKRKVVQRQKIGKNEIVITFTKIPSFFECVNYLMKWQHSFIGLLIAIVGKGTHAYSPVWGQCWCWSLSWRPVSLPRWVRSL